MKPEKEERKVEPAKVEPPMPRKSVAENPFEKMI